ncbi:MAG: hypothetical protein AAB693_00595 [Patescibacteria group bacterium]
MNEQAPKNKKIIALEGTIKAGKTTLAGGIEKTLNAGVVWEYGKYLNGRQFPIFPPRDLEVAKKVTEFFASIEQERLEDLEKIIKDIVVVDRIHHSCLAVNYTADKLYKTNYFGEMEEIWKRTAKITPDVAIYLYVGQQELERRLAPTKHLYREIFYNRNFNDFIREYYAKLGFILIDTTNMTEGQVLLTALSYV